MHGGNSKKRGAQKKTEFLNKAKQVFEWDKAKIEGGKVLVKDKVAYPKIPANMPRVYLEEDQTILGLSVMDDITSNK